jgi:putative peptide zinc metalloprotease protein
LAEENLRSIREEHAALEDQLRRLRIVAPCDGKVIAVPLVSPSREDPRHSKLPAWHGSPLEPRNTGCFLAAGTHVLSIAPDDRCRAVLLIDQFDRFDFGAAGEARVKIDHLPERTLCGPVIGIATGTTDLSESRTDQSATPEVRAAAKTGLAPQTTAAYQATVILPDDAPTLLSGTRGRARILVARRSAAAWLWRYARNTFRFQL